MVKRKRIPSVPGCEEKSVYSNGLTSMETSDCVGSPDVDTTSQQQQQQLQQREEEVTITSSAATALTDDAAAATVSGIRSNVRQAKTSNCSPTPANAELQVVSFPKEGVPDDPSRKAVPSITGPTLRSSARVQKRPGRDSSPTVTSKPAKKNGAVSTKPGTSTEQGKVRRAWEQWSVEDKNTFFEALCEFGKDFENIQNYIVQKNRKKGHPPQVIKNKDQVRHFYYRTWHKISKHLDISDDVKKQAQELYGLINFGELRKKIGGRLDEKNGQKLNELVHKGATTIRCKGKNLRIKTPICRALKRLNDVEADPKDYENSKLPARICIELRPRNNQAWSHVQSIAQNPRVRLTVSLQRRLTSIITFLQQRWKAPALKQKDQLLKLCLESEDFQEQPEPPLVEETEAVLRLLPRKCERINLVSVNASTEISSASVSLQNYRRKVQCLGDVAESTAAPCIKKNVKAGKGKPNAGADELKKITSDDKHSPNAKANHKHVVEMLTSQQRNVDGVSDCGDKYEPHQSDVLGDFKFTESHHEESNSVPAHEVTLRQLLALETAANPAPQTDMEFFPLTPSFLCESLEVTPVVTNTLTDEMKDCCELNVDKTCDKNDSTTMLVDSSPVNTNEQEDMAKMELQERAERLEKIKRGWILKDCCSVTVGEIYLMLGHPSRLILEYEWEFSESKPPSSPLLDSPTIASSSSSVQQLTTILGRLLQTASSTFSDLSKAKQDRQGTPLLQPCRCGHHCCSAMSTAKSVLPKSAATVRSPSGVRSAKSFKVALTKAVSMTDAAVTSITTLVTVPGSTNIGTVNAQSDMFRKPTVAPAPSQAAVSKLLTTSSQSEKLVPCDKALKEQLDKYTQHRKAKGRMKKSVFVQRELPLLPKAGPTHSMMTLRIVPNSTQLAGSFVPLLHTSALPTGGEEALRQSAAMHAKMVSLSTASGISNNVSTLMTTHLGGLTTTGPIMTTAGLTMPKIAVATPIRVAGTSSLTATPLTTKPVASAGCALILNNAGLPKALQPKPVVDRSTAALALPCSTATMELISTMTEALVSSSNTNTSAKDGSSELTHLTYSHQKYPSLSMRVLQVQQENAISSSVSQQQPSRLGTSVVQDFTLTLPSTSAAAPKQIVPEISIIEAGLATKLSVSPPCISSILGISLPGPDGAESANISSDVSTDKLLGITLGNSNSGFSGLISLTTTNTLINDEEAVSLPTPIISNDVGLGARPSTPVNSPTNSLFKISSPGMESHWFNGDVSEFSLSNFLSHLESPAKVSAPVASAISQTENTSDMDPNFHCVMNENCIDYISKFEDFAAQMTTGDSQSSKKNV